jgi:hypothetical protein
MRKTEKGAATALFAVMLTVIVAGLGFAIDGGHAYELRRRLQAAADAAALSAAQELRRGNVGTYTKAALDDAKRNGFTASNAEFEIMNPPKTGPRKGNASFVEVLVRSESPAYFMRLFRDPMVEVEARAVAGVLPSKKCIYTLDPHAKRSFWATNSAKVNLGTCGIQVNSDDDDAARTHGGCTVTAGTIDVVGDYTGSGFLPVPTTGVKAQADPWADLPPPTYPACKKGEKGLTVKSTMTISPGNICGGLTVASDGNLTLKAGVYVIVGGGLKVSGKGKLTGKDVTIYLTEATGYNFDAVDFMGDSVGTLSAPTSGPYAGILFFQDRNVDSNKVSNFKADSTISLTGGLYFPTTDIKFQGDSDVKLQKLMIIARNLEFRGHVDLSAPDAVGMASPYVMQAGVVY